MTVEITDPKSAAEVAPKYADKVFAQFEWSSFDANPVFNENTRQIKNTIRPNPDVGFLSQQGVFSGSTQ